MTLAKRRILFIVFLIIFIITTPLVLLYTAGYRYNFKRNKIQRTGVLFLDSKPKDATVFINSKATRQKTPTRISAMLPDEYLIRLEKDEFMPWQKTLEIESAKTTFATEIFLPKEVTPEKILSTGGEKIFLAPSNNYLLIANSFKGRVSWRIFDLSTNKFTILATTFGDIEDEISVSWSQDSNLAIIKIISKLNRFLIFNKKQLSLFDVNIFFDERILTAKLDPVENNIAIIGTPDGRFRFNIEKKLKLFLDKLNYSDYLIQAGRLFAIQKKLGDLSLIADELTSAGKNIKTLYKLPLGTYTFLETPPGFITLKKKESDLLMVLRITEEAQTVFEDKVEQAHWLKTGAGWKLVYIRDFELWTFDLDKKEKNLVTRLGTSIKKVAWFSDGNYLLFLSNNVVRMAELDNRDGRNIWNLAETDALTDFTLDNNNDVLYFSGKFEDEENFILFKRALR